ncbi:MAG TPA: hypothetical protein VK053_04695 [Jiangellaceae bacterium]|nr:hypothetical protein [Jiangellaceae bacterium]
MRGFEACIGHYHHGRSGRPAVVGAFRGLLSLLVRELSCAALDRISDQRSTLWALQHFEDRRSVHEPLAVRVRCLAPVLLIVRLGIDGRVTPVITSGEDGFHGHFARQPFRGDIEVLSDLCDVLLLPRPATIDPEFLGEGSLTHPDLSRQLHALHVPVQDKERREPYRDPLAERG